MFDATRRGTGLIRRRYARGQTAGSPIDHSKSSRCEVLRRPHPNERSAGSGWGLQPAPLTHPYAATARRTSSMGRLTVVGSSTT